MTFHELATAFSLWETESSRLVLREMVAELYQKLSPTEIEIVSYLIMERVAPSFIPAEFNISNKLLEKVLLESTSADEQALKEQKQKIGDLGDTAAELIKTEDEQLSIEEVYKLLWRIVKTEGTGSVEKKKGLIKSLQKQLTPMGVKFLYRLLVGKMRLGVSDKTVIDALSFAQKESTEDRPVIERAYGRSSDLGFVARIYLQDGLKGLKDITIIPGVPLASKLVERESTWEKVWERIPNPIVQPKYDGMRCQIHGIKTDSIKDKLQESMQTIWTDYYFQSEESGQKKLFAATESPDKYQIELFSRNLERLTEMFPEVVADVKRLMQEKELESVIFDAELIGYNENTEEYLLFQKTMTRRRKHNVQAMVDEVPIKSFVFDVLYKNGHNLLMEPLHQRMKILKDMFTDAQPKDVINISPVYQPKSVEELQALFQEEIAKGLEGVIIKDPDSKYEPGTRNFKWIKFKKAMESELADTVDVVLLGYYYGQGRLTEFGIGALLAGVYDREIDQFLSITKIGTGINDEQWQSIKQKCDEHAVKKMPNNVQVPKDLSPDVWLAPQLVVEVEADQVTKSPLHESGFALRFPRFVRFRQKDAVDSTSLSEIVKLAGLSVENGA